MEAGTQIEPYVQHIRDALWRSSGQGMASVMVGAGFSRNAEPATPSARQFPLWDQLAHEMAEGIGLKDDKPRDPLLIAQMFASMLGSAELHRLIERCVPDAERCPGELHRRLLALPWADVFTTNYDTLLERACRETYDRRYEVILTPQDLPMRQPQRLVKLHGTLGVGGQLIATQEDYRRYPETHAPFVNLVRQSVMETVFVLIGFAGDDPNFLEWTGWVRDVLGDQAPKIYLCGMLDCSPSMRALLDSRRVTPIDLSEVVGHCEEGNRHAKALDWLLAALESGKPGRPLRWAPIVRNPAKLYQPPLPPVRGFTAFSGRPQRTKQGEFDGEQFRVTTEKWREQREQYPGWHVAPDVVRTRIWHGLSDWRAAVFFHADALSPSERILLARELCWRLELCLSPVFTNETDKLVVWLESINPFGQRLQLPGAASMAESESCSLRDAWIALAVHVLRTAREDLDETRYQCWRERLLQVGDRDPTLLAELQHEEVLLQLNRLDLARLREVLANWRATAKQPLELARLAALYAELGDVKTAHELGLAGLNVVRAGTRTCAAISQEAWSCVLLQMLNSHEPAQTEMWRERIDLAKDQGYSPWETIEALRIELNAPRPERRKGKKREVGFDAGDIRQTVNFGAEDHMMPAYQFLRLIERAPCPLYAGHAGLGGAIAAHAAVWIGDGAPFWSLAILMRAGAQPQVLNEVFDRAAIACLDEVRIGQLHAQLLRMIEAEVLIFDAAEGVDDALGFRAIKTGLDVLSRIALRLQPTGLTSLLDRVALWLTSRAFINRYILHEPLGWLVQRVLEALPDELLTSGALLLLDVPMLGEPGCQPKLDHHWPEPFDSEGLGDRSVSAPAERPDSWSRNWGRLLMGMRQEAHSSWRENAFIRAYFLHRNGWLNAAEKMELGAAVWSCVDSTSGLPSLKGYLPTVVLHLPPVEGNDSAALVRRLLLGDEPKPWKREERGFNTGLSDAFLMWAGQAENVFSHPSIHSPQDVVLPLDDTEAEALLRRLLEWLSSAKAVLLNPTWRNLPFGSFKPEKVIEHFCVVLSEVVLPRLPAGHLLCSTLETELDSLSKEGFSIARATLGRLIQFPNSKATLIAGLERDLITQDEHVVRAAAHAIASWRRAAKGSLVEEVPTSLVVLLVARIALREMVALDSVTNSVVGFVESNQLDQRSEGQLLLALERLAAETSAELLRNRYERGEIGRTAVAEGLHIRGWAGLLASKMAEGFTRRGAELPEVLKKWKVICETDALPEIRRAWRMSA